MLGRTPLFAATASAGELNLFSDESSELNSVKWCVNTADAVLS